MSQNILQAAASRYPPLLSAGPPPLRSLWRGGGELFAPLPPTPPRPDALLFHFRCLPCHVVRCRPDRILFMCSDARDITTVLWMCCFSYLFWYWSNSCFCYCEFIIKVNLYKINLLGICECKCNVECLLICYAGRKQSYWFYLFYEIRFVTCREFK